MLRQVIVLFLLTSAVTAAVNIDSVSFNATSIAENGWAVATIDFTGATVDGQYRVVIDWGDGESSDEVVTSIHNNGTAEIGHTYTDDDPSGTPSDDYIVTVTVTDLLTAESVIDDTTVITVNNQAPAILGVSSSLSIAVDRTYLFQVLLSDIGGASDLISYRIDWGDGSVDTVGEVVGSVSWETLTVGHVYTNVSTPSITISIEDDDTGADSHTVVVSVVSAPETALDVSTVAVRGGRADRVTLDSLGPDGVLTESGDTWSLEFDLGLSDGESATGGLGASRSDEGVGVQETIFHIGETPVALKGG